MLKNKPTPEQLAALSAFAAQHGPDWKATLNDAWLTGCYDSATVRREHDGLLQQVRNQCGRRWLRAATVLVEVAR